MKLVGKVDRWDGYVMTKAAEEVAKAENSMCGERTKPNNLKLPRTARSHCGSVGIIWKSRTSR
jgi:hypothetical protein